MLLVANTLTTKVHSKQHRPSLFFGGAFAAPCHTSPVLDSSLRLSPALFDPLRNGLITDCEILRGLA
jgi:hypothetical protein